VNCGEIWGNLSQRILAVKNGKKKTGRQPGTWESSAIKTSLETLSWKALSQVKNGGGWEEGNMRGGSGIDEDVQRNRWGVAVWGNSGGGEFNQGG